MKKKRKSASGKWKIKKRARVGALPGYISSSQHELSIRISVISYNETHCQEEEEASLKTIEALVKSTNKRTWINVTGLQDKKTISKLAQILDIHPLSII